MLNKLRVLFVSLRPSQAIFFFFFKSNLYMTVISSFRKKPQLLFLRKKAELSYFGEL